jgi:Na+-transporting methylmalonyl-CoA/oxaloacetate decarboxylase gamma subunit
MNDLVTTALLITVIGMGLVFISILLLWLMMAVLVKVTTVQNDDENTVNTKQNAQLIELDRKRRAALAAVTVALARQADSMDPHAFPLPPTAIVSAWQAVLRTRMLMRRGQRR